MDKKNSIPRKHKERFERETFKLNNSRGFIIVSSIIFISLGLVCYNLIKGIDFFSYSNLVINITLALSLVILTMLVMLRMTKIRDLAFARACDLTLMTFALFWAGYLSIGIDGLTGMGVAPFVSAMFVLVLMQYHPPKLSITLYSAFTLAYIFIRAANHQDVLSHVGSYVQVLVALGFAILGSIVMYDARKQSFMNKLMNEQFEKLSLTDSLTNIPNRRYFDNALQSAWRFCMRENRSIALAMIDIDHFKIYNDTYGHLMGDHCLTLVAETISRCAGRGMDQIMRYGGEEFVILMPGSDVTAGLVVAERARRAVADMRILHRNAPTVPYITISVGLVAINPANTDMSIPELIKSADEALYNSKKDGRNRVSVYRKSVQEKNIVRFDK